MILDMIEKEYPFPLAQRWHGMTLIAECHLDAKQARIFAQESATAGDIGRIFLEPDNVEVYLPDGSVRRGTFAETVYVTIYR